MKIENITLRDWFAAQAINGLIHNKIELSKYELVCDSEDHIARSFGTNGEVILAIPDVCNLCPDKDGYQELAEAAYALSDAMLLARK